jgi:hypothetical protein
VTELLPFTTALRAELLAAATRVVAARRRRARRVAAASAVVVVLALVVSASVLVRLDLGRVASADVVVEVDDGEVVVTLQDIEQRPERIEAAVRAAGLDVSIAAVPVGPSRVGRFLGRETAGSVPPELRWLDDLRGFALPVGWSGSLRLLVGEPADGDEPYAVFSDALLPGEPLACRAIVGRRAADVAAELATTDVAARYVALEEGRNEPLGDGEVRTGPRAGWAVVVVEATSRHSVVVRLQPDPVGLRPVPAGCPG